LQKGLGLRLFHIISQRPHGQQSQQCQQKTSLPMPIQMRGRKYFPTHQHLSVAFAAFSYLSLINDTAIFLVCANLHSIAIVYGIQMERDN
jgi:hypothetical protein